MSVVRYILLLALAFVLQTTWVDSIKVGLIKPDLLIVALSFIALRSGSVVGAYMGLGVGILQDIYLPAALGANAPRQGAHRARVSATAMPAWSPTASKSRPRWSLVP